MNKTASKSAKTATKRTRSRPKKPKTSESIKKSLLQQLKNHNADIEVFKNQIDDYMALWELKELYKEDIKKYGLRLDDGKENPSCKNLTNVNKQMLMLLKMLNISTDNILFEVDDDEL
jgi:hypothetical protein